MAYVVARPHGGFEIRESLHTAKGPRARTLAGFHVLTDDVLAKAGKRAQRPFDASAVLASAQRAKATHTTSSPAWSTDRFVTASRRMAQTVKAAPGMAARRADPGTALIELLGFADAVAASQPPRGPEPLAFPALARLAKRRRGHVSSHQ